MNRRSIWIVVYRCFSLMRALGPSVAMLTGVIMKTSAADLGTLRPMIEYIQRNSAWFVLISGTAGALGAFGCHWLGPPWAWEAIDAILNKFRDRAFEGQAGEDYDHHHRVTLFRHGSCWRLRLCWRKGRLPWSGWLIPVARSGFVTQRCETVFLAPDDADNAEGIAGKAWATREPVHVDNLPELVPGANDADIKAYAEKSFVSVDWVNVRLKEGRRFYRSIIGIRIEVPGRVWGVIVLDSVNPKPISTKAHFWSVYVELIPFFSAQLLKRI